MRYFDLLGGITVCYRKNITRFWSLVECFTVYNTVSWTSTWVWRSFLIFLWILPQPSISILRLGHCTCPTWLGWQHRATSITGSLPVCLASKRQTDLIFWRHSSHIRTASLSALHAAWCVFLVPHVQWIMERSLRWSCCISTEALKGHRVVWKIEICYLIRMT